MALWVGVNFDCPLGTVVELPDEIAAARIAAGLARPYEDPVPPVPMVIPPAPPEKRGPGRPRKV